MSGFADYERYDALGLAERRKAVSPNDLLEAAIERVEARNAAVNAVVMPLYDYGRKAIQDGLPDGPWAIPPATTTAPILGYIWAHGACGIRPAGLGRRVASGIPGPFLSCNTYDSATMLTSPGG